MADVISKVIPILLLIIFGYYIRYKSIFREKTVNELKKIIVNVCLPSIIFLTFKDMVIKREHIFIIIFTFLLLVIFYFVGLLVNKIQSISHPILPFMNTGFTFGLLGLSLYGSVFGIENLGKIAVFGVANEIFIWFILYTLMRIKFKEKFSLDNIKHLIKTPLIIAILLGITINVTQINAVFEYNAILKGIENTLISLTEMAIPLLLIIIGYGIKLDKEYIRKSTQIVIIRFCSVLIIAYTLKILVLNRFSTFDPLLDHAFFAFLILPPAMSSPLLLKEYSNNSEYSDLATNTVVLNTIITVIVYVLYVFIVS